MGLQHTLTFLESLREPWNETDDWCDCHENYLILHLSSSRCGTPSALLPDYSYIIISGYQPSQFITIYLLDSFQSKSLVVAPKHARHNYASLFHQLETFQTMHYEFVVKIIMWHKLSFAFKLLFISLNSMWTSVRGSYMKVITPTEGFWLLKGFTEIL